MTATRDILSAIGGTPVVELQRVAPGGSARVLVKLESHNPTGSMKDRMALAVIRGAAASGKLAPGGTVVEYTGGSTGTSLAFVCAAMSYPITLVTSDAFSREKRDHMRALGANVIELLSEGISVAEKQEILERIDIKKRLERITTILNKELQVLELGSKIQVNLRRRWTRISGNTICANR